MCRISTNRLNALKYSVNVKCSIRGGLGAWDSNKSSGLLTGHYISILTANNLVCRVLTSRSMSYLAKSNNCLLIFLYHFD